MRSGRGDSTLQPKGVAKLKTVQGEPSPAPLAQFVVRQREAAIELRIENKRRVIEAGQYGTKAVGIAACVYGKRR